MCGGPSRIVEFEPVAAGYRLRTRQPTPSGGRLRRGGGGRISEGLNRARRIRQARHRDIGAVLEDWVLCRRVDVLTLETEALTRIDKSPPDVARTW